MSGRLFVLGKPLAKQVVSQPGDRLPGLPQPGLDVMVEIPIEEQMHVRSIASLNVLRIVHTATIHRCSIAVNPLMVGEPTLSYQPPTGKVQSVLPHEAIRAWRKRSGLSQMSLALQVGVEQVTISRYESPSKARRDVALLAKIALALRAPSVDALLAGPSAETTDQHPPTVRSPGGSADSSPPVEDIREITMVSTFEDWPETFAETDSAFSGRTPMPRNLAKHNDVALVRLSDQSMYPTFPAGCYVLIDLSIVHPYQSEAVAVRRADGSTVFRLFLRGAKGTTPRLVPANHEWGPGTAIEAGDTIIGVWLATVQASPRRVK